jgi:hypothetical protein
MESEELGGSLLPAMVKKGKIVTQIITFSNGNKKTFRGIKVSSICQGEFTHFELLDGRMIYINPKNVDFFEVFAEDDFEEKEIKKGNKKENEEEKRDMIS